MPLIGYARVSTEDQTPLPQSEALQSAGCAEIIEEHASGGNPSEILTARVPESRRSLCTASMTELRDLAAVRCTREIVQRPALALPGQELRERVIVVLPACAAVQGNVVGGLKHHQFGPRNARR